MSSLKLAFLLVVAVGLLYSSSAQVFPASKEEVEVCQKKADGLGEVYKDAKKEGRIDCKVKCYFESGETSVENTPDTTLCCPVGGMFTGTCKDGDCKVGSMG